MAHFAQLDSENVVTNVIVIADEDTADSNGNEVESIGVAFCQQLFGSDTNWKQTSINNNMRTRFAGIGATYSEELDAFIEPKPYESWVFNAETKAWDPPVPKPSLTEEEIEMEAAYIWDEEVTDWVLDDPDIDPQPREYYPSVPQ